MFFIIIFLLISKSCGEFSSLPYLRKLVLTEAKLKSLLDNYIDHELERLKKLEIYAESFDIRIKNDQLDTELKISNPISAYSLISRLVQFPKVFLPEIKQSYENGQLLLEEIKKLQLPDVKDLEESIGILLGLQNMYHLSSEELANGRILGKKYNKMLTSLECREIGFQANQNNYLPEAIEWFKLARKRVTTKELLSGVSYRDFNFDLINAYYKAGKYSEGLEFLNELIEEEPNYKRYLDYKSDFENALRTEKSKSESIQEELIINKLCRNERSEGDKKSFLKCFYKTTLYNFLTLAPFKVEIISLEPKIYLFHDVLSDDEISILKGLSYEKLIEWKHFQELNHIQYYSSGFIEKNSHKIIPKIFQRIEDMSDLKVSSEPLQINNYAIGGFSSPQFDYFEKDYKEKFHLNDRLATVTFYLSDTEFEFGALTIFPTLNTVIVPKRGSALFWMNLNVNGEGDIRTLHAECPLILGTKWTAAKYLLELDQSNQECTKRIKK